MSVGTSRRAPLACLQKRTWSGIAENEAAARKCLDASAANRTRVPPALGRANADRMAVGKRSLAPGTNERPVAAVDHHSEVVAGEQIHPILGIDGHVGHIKWRWPKTAKSYSTLVVNDDDLRDLRKLQKLIPEP